ncbi:MAG TPA: hypothetical protein VK787_10505 [Puia sp.]|jgi:hypothetical protein|nr:hypothetical protein [Puia sp.]
MIRIFTHPDSLKASISNLLENCWHTDRFIAKKIGMSEVEFSAEKQMETGAVKNYKNLLLLYNSK